MEDDLVECIPRVAIVVVLVGLVTVGIRRNRKVRVGDGSAISREIRAPVLVGESVVTEEEWGSWDSLDYNSDSLVDNEEERLVPESQ